MIRETCSCGATFTTDDNRYITGRPDWNTLDRRLVSEWREGHKCVETVTLTEVRESGPGLGDVIERLDKISSQLWSMRHADPIRQAAQAESVTGETYTSIRRDLP